MSRLPPACRPPEIMLTIGIGKAGSSGGRVCRRSESLPPEPVQMNEQLFAARGRRRVRHGQRDAEHGVGPEPALVRRAVERDQPGVEAGLIVQVHAQRPPGRSRASRCRRPWRRPGRRSAGCRRRAARAPRAGPCSPPTARSPARRPRSRRSPRPPRSAGRASRAPGGPSAPSKSAMPIPLPIASSRTMHKSSHVAGSVRSASRANDRATAWPAASRYSTGLLPSTRARQQAAVCRLARRTSSARRPSRVPRRSR